MVWVERLGSAELVKPWLFVKVEVGKKESVWVCRG